MTQIEKFLFPEQLTSVENNELIERLGYLAFNLTTNRFDRSHIDRFQLSKILLPDAAEKEQAIYWMFNIDSKKPQKAQLSIQDRDKGFQLLQWAEEARFVTQTDQLVFFDTPLLQTYFCTSYCRAQPFDSQLLKSITTNPFEEVWQLWSNLDRQLVIKLLELLQGSSDTPLRINSLYALSFINDFNTINPILQILVNKDEDRKLRIEIAKEFLVRLQSWKAAKVLETIFQDNEEDKSLRRIAVQSLAQYGKVIIPSLITTFNESDDNVIRRLAVFGLGCTRNKQVVSSLLNALRYGEAQSRIEAASALRLIDAGDILEIELLVQALQDPEKTVRLYAVEALGRFKVVQALEPLFSLLGKERDTALRNAIISVLGQLEDKRAVPYLILALDDLEKEIIATQAVYSLSKIGDTRAISPLLSKLINRNENPELRRACAYSLIDMDEIQAVEVIIYILEAEANPAWKIIAAHALGKFGHPKAFEILVNLFYDKDWRVNLRAAEALGQLKDNRAFNLFVDNLKNENLNIRRAVVRGLGRLKDNRAVEPLIQILKDVEPDVRYEAAKVLGHFGASTALPVLEWLKWNDLGKNARNDQVRYAAAMAIEQINQK